MDTKKHIIDLESFRDILHICLRVPGQSFAEPPFEEEILTFIHFLGHSAAIRTLTNVNINKLYQPWRSFAALINKCLTGKSFGYDSLRLSQAQILWGLYHKRNIDYAYLMWEDFVYQVEYKNQKKSNEMYYPRFTKPIIHHFMSKDPSIPRRIKFGAMLPIELTNDEIRNSKAYKEYYEIAIGEATPKPKASVRRTRSSSDTSITSPTTVASPRPKASANGKQTAKASKAKSLSALSECSGVDKGTSSKPGVPNVPTDESEEELSWNSTDDEGDDNKGKDDDGDEEDEGDDGEEGNGNDDDEDDDGNEETREEESFDPIPQTPEDSEDESDGEEDLGLNIGEEERHDEEEEEDELYQDVNINQGRGLQVTLEVEDTHMTLTPVKPDVQTVDENMKKIIKEQVKEQVKAQVSKILPRIEQAMNEQLDAKVLTRSSHSSRTSYAVAADLSEMELKKILIEKIEGNKSIQRLDEQRNLYKALVDAYESDKIILDTYGETVTLKRRRDDDEDKDEEPFDGPDRGSKKRREGKDPESASAPTETITRSAGRSTQGSRSRKVSASESALAEEPLQTTSQMEEPSHLEFKTDLASCPRKHSTVDKRTGEPLPLIPDNQGLRVIPFAHFINNDLECLWGGVSSQKYTTSVKKTKAADYGHIKWIKELVPRTIWIQQPINNDKHALWGRRIIAVMKLKIVEWHSYKHLDWITIRRDDDKLYKFKEGDYKRLRIQDIEDMLLLLRCVEDLQLGVESYQKRLNLTKLDTYRLDLKRKEAYSAYSNPRGFIYQNKDKRNRLMRIDELHKFSNGTLTDVRTALYDRLKGIQMRYLPQTIWRKSDKDRAAAMIQAIDKRLKTRRIMRSLERFVGGRLYEGDFRMLQRTI
nr:hypothetical protein [Tanacetum cinerariifolium]